MELLGRLLKTLFVERTWVFVERTWDQGKSSSTGSDESESDGDSESESVLSESDLHLNRLNLIERAARLVIGKRFPLAGEVLPKLGGDGNILPPVSVELRQQAGT